MKLIRLLPCLALVLAALAAAACGAAATPTPTATAIPAATATPAATPTPERAGRAAVLQSLTALVILPGYTAAADSVARLHESAASLCAAPGPDARDAARQHWRAARQAWRQTEAYRFGPAMERRSASLVDWHPVDAAKIDARLKDGERVTGERVREYLPATQRGLGAAEHLLFAPGGDALAGPGGAERCAYLAAVTAVAAAETAGIRADWQGDGETPGYAGFYDGTAASSLLDREAEAVAVRSLVFQVRAIANMRLAPALGLDGAADVAAIPSGAADNSRAELQSQLDGIAALYAGGAGGLGLSDRVRALSADTDARMLTAIDAASAAVRGLGGSLIARLADAPAEVSAVYDRIKEMQRILNTEIVSLLGVSVGFADTDGDS